MLYIDYLSTLKICNDTAVFTGGGNYVKNVLRLLRRINWSCKDIILLLPKGTDDFVEKAKDLFGPFMTVYLDDLVSYNYEENSILFLPQVNGTLLRKVKLIKSKNKSLVIYGTLHDRQHNYFKYDKYDDFYGKRKYFISKIMFYARIAYFNINYSKWIKSVDKVFTVSNYSMQMLNDRNVLDIKYFYQGSIFDKKAAYTKKENDSKRYALFVGGNRPEKNLLRTLEAFEKFCNRNPESSMKLYVTGVDKKLIECFISSGKISNKMMHERVEIFGYVSDNELNDLYRKCTYVVFTSKAEGFGLPVLEAIFYEKPVLASVQTSIPEVAGAIFKYVNAYSVDSIANGFEYMDNSKNLEFIMKLLPEKKQIIQKQIELDSKIFLYELLGIDMVSFGSENYEQ